jgi:hypothetical protein
VATDGARGLSENVGVFGLPFSDFTAMLAAHGGAEEGTETDLETGSIVAGGWATMESGRPVNMRTYSSPSLLSSESIAVIVACACVFLV